MKTTHSERNSAPMLEAIDWNKCKGLIPAIIQSVETRDILMLGYMNRDALDKTISEGKVCFFSRTKNRLWVKGETSGNYLHVHDIRLDCDSDALVIDVKPEGATCHLGTTSCFDSRFLYQIEEIVKNRISEDSEGSYVASLAKKGKARVAQKVGEEAVETVIASMASDPDEILEETADLFFHALINLKVHGLSLKEVEQVLQRRHEEKVGRSK